MRRRDSRCIWVVVTAATTASTTAAAAMALFFLRFFLNLGKRGPYKEATSSVSLKVTYSLFDLLVSPAFSFWLDVKRIVSFKMRDNCLSSGEIIGDNSFVNLRPNEEVTRDGFESFLRITSSNGEMVAYAAENYMGQTARAGANLAGGKRRWEGERRKLTATGSLKARSSDRASALTIVI